MLQIDSIDCQGLKNVQKLKIKQNSKYSSCKNSFIAILWADGNFSRQVTRAAVLILQNVIFFCDCTFLLAFSSFGRFCFEDLQFRLLAALTKPEETDDEEKRTSATSVKTFEQEVVVVNFSEHAKQIFDMTFCKVKKLDT